MLFQMVFLCAETISYTIKYSFNQFFSNYEPLIINVCNYLTVVYNYEYKFSIIRFK